MNPHLSPAEQQEFLKKVDSFEVLEAKRRREEEEAVRLFRVQDLEQLREAISKTNEQNRTCLFLSSVQ